MFPRRRRTCEYCGLPTGASPRRFSPGLSPLGLLTEEAYSDDEWEVAGNQCEECAIAGLADGTSGD